MSRILDDEVDRLRARLAEVEQALEEALVLLDEFIPHITASWAPHADRQFRDHLRLLRAVLDKGEQP